MLTLLFSCTGRPSRCARSLGCLSRFLLYAARLFRQCGKPPNLLPFSSSVCGTLHVYANILLFMQILCSSDVYILTHSESRFIHPAGQVPRFQHRFPKRRRAPADAGALRFVSFCCSVFAEHGLRLLCRHHPDGGRLSLPVRSASHQVDRPSQPNLYAVCGVRPTQEKPSCAWMRSLAGFGSATSA